MRASLIALGLCASVSASAAEPNALPELPFERYQLQNGLQVVLHHDARLPLVAVNLWYHVGAIDERPGKSGFAHLFEHMMFEGSLDVGENKHFEYLQQAGATQANATTDFDRTNFYETMPKNQLEIALWLESDRMGYLLAKLTRARLTNQIDVVKNERRQSTENAPYGLANEKLVQTLYPPNHPYHGNIIGSMEDLSHATVEDVAEFFDAYYTPANATLALAGDFDPSTAKALIEKYFGPLRGKPKPETPHIAPPVIDGQKRIQFDEPVAALSKVTIAWMGPSAFEPGTAELEILAHVISGTRSSRLDRKVTYEDLLAQSVTAGLNTTASGSVFQIDLVARAGRTLEEAEAAIDGVLADLRKNPPTESELRRALNDQETHLIQSLEILGARADRLQTYNQYLGDPGRLAWDVERYRKVTTKDLSRALETYLRDDHRVVMFDVAKKKASRAGGAE
jgi:zinc protease